MGFFKSLFFSMKTSVQAGKDYAKYTSMTKSRLLELEDEELISALLTVMRLKGEDRSCENEKKLAFLALSSLCEEMNKEGLSGFFTAFPEYAPHLSRSLELVRAKGLKAAFDRFVYESGVDLADPSSFGKEHGEALSEKAVLSSFEQFDGSFYELQEKENLHRLLSRFIRKNADELRDFAREDKR